MSIVNILSRSSNLIISTTDINPEDCSQILQYCTSLTLDKVKQKWNKGVNHAKQPIYWTPIDISQRRYFLVLNWSENDSFPNNFR